MGGHFLKLDKYTQTPNYTCHMHMSLFPMLTHFWPPGGIDLSLGCTGSQAITRCGWTQLGVPAVLQNIITVHALDWEELWATQDVDHIVPEDGCGVPALLEGAANVCPAGVLQGKPYRDLIIIMRTEWCINVKSKTTLWLKR